MGPRVLLPCATAPAQNMRFILNIHTPQQLWLEKLINWLSLWGGYAPVSGYLLDAASGIKIEMDRNS